MFDGSLNYPLSPLFKYVYVIVLIKVTLIILSIIIYAIWFPLSTQCSDYILSIMSLSKIGDCPSGRELDETTGDCDLCPRGFYKDQAQHFNC